MLATLLIAGLAPVERTLLAQTTSPGPSPSPLQALPPEALSEAGELFHRVMSPYCPGRLLADCPSPDAGELRQKIKLRIANGERPADIERELYRTFGSDLRTMPDTKGFGMSAWLLPPLVLFTATGAGLWAVARAHRRRSVEPAPITANTAPISDDMLDRIDDQLSEIR